MKLETGTKEYSVNINQHRMNLKCRYNPDSKEVILCIHGLACSMDSFRNIFDYDYFPNKSLLLLDLIGFGKSSKPENFSYTMEEQARFVEELLSTLPRWNIHIVAHSMGAAIALFFQSDFFSRVLSFTNIEGNLVSEDCGIFSRGVTSLSYNDYKNDLYKKQLIEYKGHDQLRMEETNPVAVFKSSASLIEWSDSGELLNKFRNLSCKKYYFYGDKNKDMPVLKKLDFVKELTTSSGDHMIMFNVWIKNLDELNKYLEKVNSIEGVIESCPSILHENIK